MVGGIRFVWMAKVRDYKFLLKECYQEAFLSHAAFLSCMLLRTCSDCCLVNKILYVCGKFGTCTFPVKERERATKIVQSMPSPLPITGCFQDVIGQGVSVPFRPGLFCDSDTV